VEISKLFYPGVITDPLERAVAVAMFWAGLRRSEIWGLKVEDLDWQTPKLNICHAWKRIISKKHRELGDPKWHKIREAPFPEDLQKAIKELWAANGVHDFVFCRKDGTQPGPDWIRDHLPKWMARAKVDPAGRRLVPHSARHSLASILEAKGVPLRYIQDMLGHARMETTLVYLHTPEGKINEITKKIGEVSGKETLEKATAFQTG
jgi:integrase